MLENEDPALMQKSVKKINQIRANPPKPPRARICKGIRKHVIPTLQWGSIDWWNFIDWDTARVDEHKILQKVTSEEPEEILHKPVCFPAFVSFSERRMCCETHQHPLFRRFAVKRAGIVLF